MSYYGFLFCILMILINISQFSLATYEYSPEEIFNYFNKERLSPDEYQEIISLIIETLEDIYAFNEISKNPPQPEYYNSYFTPININEKLKKINTTNISTYEFYQNVTRILAELKDPLVHINWNISHINDFYFFEPLDFYIKDIDGKQKIFGRCTINRATMKYFNYGNKIYELSLIMANDSINSINGIDSFYYIDTFGGNYLATKNPQATFSLKIRNHNKLSLKYYPLNFKDFKNFKISYENGQNIDVDFIFLSEFQINEDENPILSPPFNPPFDYISFLNINNFKEDIINLEGNQDDFIMESSNSKLTKSENNTDIKWDFYYDNFFKCLFDNENQVNVYYIHSFSTPNNKKLIEVIKNCYMLFDGNNYPILVINEINNSGDYQIAQLLLNIISPLFSFNIYGAIKIKNDLKETKEINKHLKKFADINNCSSIDFSKLISEKIEVKYTESNKIYLSNPFIIKKNKTIAEEIEEAKKYMKNKRKPTDILILTDGYSIAAGAIFIKYLQKAGGGIIAGYMGNPRRNNIYVFDSAESPSFSFNSEEINNYSEAHKKLQEKYGFKFESLPGIQTFFDYNINNKPLEYELNPIDDKIQIYEILNINNYQNYIIESKKIFEKYKIYCNIGNKKLVLVSDKCDGKFENDYTHGGFECINGKWSDHCIPTYCDQGYIFDQYIQKCVEDICLKNIGEIEEEEKEREKEEEKEKEKEKEKEEEKEIKKENEKEEENEEENDELDERENGNKSKLIWTNVIIIIFSSFILMCISIIICFKSNYCCFKKNIEMKNKPYKENKTLNLDTTTNINNSTSDMFKSITEE